jgi:hypothetical protein
VVQGLTEGITGKVRPASELKQLGVLIDLSWNGPTTRR